MELSENPRLDDCRLVVGVVLLPSDQARSNVAGLRLNFGNRLIAKSSVTRFQSVGPAESGFRGFSIFPAPPKIYSTRIWGSGFRSLGCSYLDLEV